MKNLLKKCIDELAKAEPRLDYVRGILDTLYEQEDKPVIPTPTFIPAIPSLKPNMAANPHGVPTDDAFQVLSDNPIKNG